MRSFRKLLTCPQGNSISIACQGLIKDCLNYHVCMVITKALYLRFDVHLLLHQLLDMEIVPTVILRQQSILTLKLRKSKIALRDTLLFLTGVPLSKFSSIFSLEDGEKGRFPFRLNTAEWIDFDNPRSYLGPTGERFPGLQFFLTENLRPKELANLKGWHAAISAEYAVNPSLSYNPTLQLIK